MIAASGWVMSARRGARHAVGDQIVRLPDAHQNILKPRQSGAPHRRRP